MKTKTMVETAWTEDMEQFLYPQDPDTRKITVVSKVVLESNSEFTFHLHFSFHVYRRDGAEKSPPNQDTNWFPKKYKIDEERCFPLKFSGYLVSRDQ